MKRFACAAALAALWPGVAALAQTTTIPVDTPERTDSRTAEGDFWVGLGAGLYDGKDYPRGCCDSHAHEVGGAAGHVSLNVDTGSLLLRARYSTYTDYTSNLANEGAVLVGVPLLPGRQLWVAAGASGLWDVSNRTQEATFGVPLEILVYPVRGLELMIHGNLNPDSRFIGIAIGGAIGRHRPPSR